MMDVEQNNFMKEYVDSVAGHETTIEEAQEFIELAGTEKDEIINIENFVDSITGLVN